MATRRFLLAVPVAAALLFTACGSDDSTATETTVAPVVAVTEAQSDSTTAASGADSVPLGDGAETNTDADEAATGDSTNYQIEVWADNWSAVYVDGNLIGEDSVSITTERSFNAEVFTFDASLPFTVAIEAKDFTETDSGLEYIGEQNQQMGDGGIIAQVTNITTGEVVAATDATWTALVVHQAPLNTECEDDPNPDSTCEFLILDTPADWASPDFDDSAWATATEWTAGDVSPKGGYDEIAWNASAQLIWGTDLEVDNTVLLRSTIS